MTRRLRLRVRFIPGRAGALEDGGGGGETPCPSSSLIVPAEPASNVSLTCGGVAALLVLIRRLRCPGGSCRCADVGGVEI